MGGIVAPLFHGGDGGFLGSVILRQALIVCENRDLLYWELVDRIAAIRERHGDDAARSELALQAALA